MNKKTNSYLSMGIPSMCVIFTVLCLVILSLLTLKTSQQDLKISQLALDQTSAYYTACSQATDQYQTLISCAQTALRSSQTQEDYLSQMTAVTQDFLDAAWDKDTQIFSFQIDYTPALALYIEVFLSYPTDFSDFSPQILTWKTIQSTEWIPDEHQNVYLG